MKKIMRSIQTHFPFLHNLRFAIKLKLIAWRKKPHESDFEALHFFSPNVDEVFLDIGSNRGEAIASMLIQQKFDNQVIGFEPNPLIFDKLKQFFSHQKRVLVYNYGLGNEELELPLFIPFYRNWMFDGLSSFIYESARNWLKMRLWRFDEQKLTIKKEVCQIKRLDSFGFCPYFIKIDVQGYELSVLQGATQTLVKHQPILLIESISPEIRTFLADYGYQFYTYQEGKLSKGIGTLNTYCITTKRYNDLAH